MSIVYVKEWFLKWYSLGISRGQEGEYKKSEGVGNVMKRNTDDEITGQR